MDELTEILPILQDFIPYRGAALLHIHIDHEIHKQGKGTTDHMISLDYWLVGCGLLVVRYLSVS